MTDQSSVSATPLLLRLLPMLAAVSAVFLVSGAVLAALPLYLTEQLGFGAGVLGLVAGSQFAAALVSRFWAGSYSDRRGPKAALTAGLLLGAASGVFYALAAGLGAQPAVAVTVLVLGRILLGGAESFIITSAQAWGLALAGPERSGVVIGWAGMALHLAFAAGAPVGGWLQAGWGFGAVAAATILVPLVVLAAILPMPRVDRRPGQGRRIGSVLSAIVMPGLAIAFAGVGFTAMTFFSILLFLDRDWSPVWAPVSAFSLGLVAARVLLGNLPDRLGGARTSALLCGFMAVALAVLPLSGLAAVAILAGGAVGFTYSLVYPALGREAVRRAPADSSGLAIGAFSAFFDVSVAVSSPALGLIAEAYGLASVFLLASAASLVALAISLRMLLGRTGR